MKKITQFLVALFAAAPVLAGQQLSLKEATGSAFRAETISAVKALADGESYAQISADGSQIVKYSFKTGKQTGVLFDSKTARGPKVNRVDGYIMSPDGQRMLIQTNTKAVYRHSFAIRWPSYATTTSTW